MAEDLALRHEPDENILKEAQLIALVLDGTEQALAHAVNHAIGLEMGEDFLTCQSRF